MHAGIFKACGEFNQLVLATRFISSFEQLACSLRLNRYLADVTGSSEFAQTGA